MRVKSAFLNVFVVSIIFCLCAVAVAAPTKTISGIVASADGTGVEGVDVVGDNGATSAVTAADGLYSITVPNNWTGTITASKAGWLITPASRSYNAQKVDLTDENFLAYQPKISGYVRKSDGTPLAGAVVTSNNGGGSDITDASGYYEFYVPYNWSGALSASLTGYHFTDKSYSNVIADQTNQDFSGYQPTITGSTGLAGAMITVSGVGSFISTPEYSVTVPYDWIGTIIAELVGYNFINSPLSYANVTTDLINQDFTPYQPSISGYVKKADGTVLEGASVTASNGGGSDTTNASGFYEITVPYDWSGIVSATLTGYYFVSNGYMNVIADQAGQNFSVFQPTISGSTGVAGATVTVSGIGSVVSTPEYSVLVPRGWSGTVEVALTDYHFPESPRLYTNVLVDLHNQNFTSYQPTISGTIKTEDGVPLEGITLIADNGGGSDITNEYGYYEIIVPYDWSGLVTVEEELTRAFSPEYIAYSNVTYNQTSQDFTRNYADIQVALDGSYDFMTIQSAINASISGDEIIVNIGRYYENINFLGKNIVLRSTNPLDSHVVEATIIDANNIGSVVKFYGTENSLCTLTGFTITNGNANSGGGVSGGGTHASIANCVITSNRANEGGGLYYFHGSIDNCMISGNIVGYGYGGGLNNCDGSIKNCVVTGNTVKYDGGGLYSCDGTIVNCTIVGNIVSYGSGGGIAQTNGSITNCIVWGNSCKNPGVGLLGDQLYNSSSPTYSCIQNWIGEGMNIAQEPLFRDTTATDPADWDLHLWDGSPCIDAGLNSPPGGLPAIDIEGNPRLFDGNNDGYRITDMGAYEFQGILQQAYLYTTPRTVAISALEEGNNPANQTITIKNFGNNILNWFIDITDKPEWLTISPLSGSLGYGENDTVTVDVDIMDIPAGNYSYLFEVTGPMAQNNPQIISVNLLIGKIIIVPDMYSTIQTAVNTASDGDMVVVSPGRYYENINFNGKNIILTSTNPIDPNIIETTIIDGNGNDGVIKFSGEETSDCMLRGFTITNGYVSHPGGGGVQGNGMKALIENCIITDNTAKYGGGLYTCDGPIRDCTIAGNAAQYGGGGLAYCHGMIVRCMVTENSVQGDGGGVYWCGSPMIVDSTISNNTADRGGGLFMCDGLTISCNIANNTAQKVGGGLCNFNGTIINSLITDNTAVQYDGGGFHWYSSITPKFYNCTIVNNVANRDGGGVFNCNGSITNCIFWGNIAGGLGDQLQNSSLPAFSCIQNWSEGGLGNIVSNPIFSDPNEGDYHLKSKLGRWDDTNNQWVYDDVTSPCIDAGDPNDASWQNELWPHGGWINIGAYGGTPQASMSPNDIGNPADLNHDNAVDIADWSLWADDWLAERTLLDSDFDRDNDVDPNDLDIFMNNWLWME